MKNHLKEPVQFGIKVNWTPSDINGLYDYYYLLEVYTDEDLEKLFCDSTYLENFMKLLEKVFAQVNKSAFPNGFITTKITYKPNNIQLFQNLDPKISTDFLYSKGAFILLDKKQSINQRYLFNSAINWTYTWGDDEDELSFIVRPVIAGDWMQ